MTNSDTVLMGNSWFGANAHVVMQLSRVFWSMGLNLNESNFSPTHLNVRHSSTYLPLRSMVHRVGLGLLEPWNLSSQHFASERAGFGQAMNTPSLNVLSLVGNHRPICSVGLS